MKTKEMKKVDRIDINKLLTNMTPPKFGSTPIKDPFASLIPATTNDGYINGCNMFTQKHS